MNFLTIPFIRLASVRIRYCTWKRNNAEEAAAVISRRGSHFSVHSNAGCEARLTDTLSLRDRQTSISKLAALAWKPEKGKARKCAPGPNCKYSSMESRNAIGNQWFRRHLHYQIFQFFVSPDHGIFVRTSTFGSWTIGDGLEPVRI